MPAIREIVWVSRMGSMSWDGDGALGDVGGIVAHALEVARHLERGGDDPEVHRDRLTQRQDAHRELVDLGLQRVHPLVLGDHAGRELIVAADQRGDGGRALLLDDAAHLQDRVVHAIQLLVIGLDRVLGSHQSSPVLSLQPRPRLAEAPSNIVLRPLIVRIGEYLLSRLELHKLAQVEERRELGDPRGLLHVVGDDRDRVVLAKLVDQLLHLGRWR